MNMYHFFTIGMFAAFAITDICFRARAFPDMRYWRRLGLAATIAYFSIATFAPFLWDGMLGAHRLFDLTGLAFWAQLAIGFFVLEAGTYVWHRTMHKVTPIWRIHQTHHSAERIDIWSAFYFHPLDMAGWSLLGSLCLVWIVGLTAEATLVVSVAATFCAMFQHSNLRTPRWLGYIITRPESHSVHHQRGVHAYNYGDVPWFDMMFGTFRNPDRFDGAVGFHDGASRRFWTLLTARTVE
jgi:sterol desaturase/sphingolipid hydroxylase (fatty acid hydroxylase superfamily)